MTIAQAERMVGRASRVAYIVPLAKPFVAALWGALSGAKAATVNNSFSDGGPGRAATKRFATGAKWFRALLRQDDEAFLPLRRVVHASLPEPASASGWAIQFDASTSGGGAILRHGRHIIEYFHCVWTLETAGHLGVKPGLSDHMTFWEFLTLVWRCWCGVALHDPPRRTSRRQHRSFDKRPAPRWHGRLASNRAGAGMAPS